MSSFKNMIDIFRNPSECVCSPSVRFINLSIWFPYKQFSCPFFSMNAEDVWNAKGKWKGCSKLLRELLCSQKPLFWAYWEWNQMEKPLNAFDRSGVLSEKTFQTTDFPLNLNFLSPHRLKAFELLQLLKLACVEWKQLKCFTRKRSTSVTFAMLFTLDVRASGKLLNDEQKVYRARTPSS